MDFLVAHHPVETSTWKGDVLARAFVECLRELGHDAELATTTIAKGKRGDHLLLVGCASSACVKGDWDGPVGLYNVAEAYIYGPRWWKTFIRWAETWNRPRLDYILDYSPNNEDAFRRMGVSRWSWCPLGSHPLLSDGIPDEDLYDVGFLGRVATGTRRDHMASLLPPSSYVYRYMDARRNRHWSKGREWNVRQALRARVFLHCHAKLKGTNFPAARVVLHALPNRRFMLCEESSWEPPGLREAGGIVYFGRNEWGQMVRVIDKALSDEEWRREVAGRGYEWHLKNRLSEHLGRSLSHLGV